MLNVPSFAQECSLEFLKNIMSGKKKYLLQSQIMNFHVPNYPLLTFGKDIK